MLARQGKQHDWRGSSSSEDGASSETSDDMSNINTLDDENPLIQDIHGLVETAITEFANWRTHQQTSDQATSDISKAEGKDGSAPPRFGKRIREICNDSAQNNEGEDEDERARHPKKKVKEYHRTGVSLFFACPYYKKNNIKHRGCLRNFQLRRIKDVKQHLYRKHRQVQFCPICGEEFDTKAKQSTHIRAQSCQRQDFNEPEGISEDHEQKITLRVDRKANPIQQWHSVWDIIFPGEEYPSSVYVNDLEIETLISFREFVSKRGPAMIANLVQSRDPPIHHWNEERELQAMFNTLLRDATAAFIDRLHGNSPEDSEASSENAPSLFLDVSSTVDGQNQNMPLPSLVFDDEFLNNNLRFDGDNTVLESKPAPLEGLDWNSEQCEYLEGFSS